MKFKDVLNEATTLKTGVAKEIKAGLGSWMIDMITARKAGNSTMAKKMIKELKKKLKNDYETTMMYFGDPDKVGTKKVISKIRDFMKK